MRGAMHRPLTFAIPKGRILDEALPLMAQAGVVPDAEFHDKGSRALSFACAADPIWGTDMRLIRVRAFRARRKLNARFGQLRKEGKL